MRFRSTKAAEKLRTLLDLRGLIPTFIHISDDGNTIQSPVLAHQRTRRLLHQESGLPGLRAALHTGQSKYLLRHSVRNRRILVRCPGIAPPICIRGVHTSQIHPPFDLFAARLAEGASALPQRCLGTHVCPSVPRPADSRSWMFSPSSYFNPRASETSMPPY